MAAWMAGGSSSTQTGDGRPLRPALSVCTQPAGFIHLNSRDILINVGVTWFPVNCSQWVSGRLCLLSPRCSPGIGDPKASVYNVPLHRGWMDHWSSSWDTYFSFSDFQRFWGKALEPLLHHVIYSLCWYWLTIPSQRGGRSVNGEKIHS